VLRLHAELPLDDRYLRFFSAGTADSSSWPTSS
jgi:hypothetical protein